MIYDNLTSAEDRLGFNFSQPFIGINYREIHLLPTFYSCNLFNSSRLPRYRIISGFHKNLMELLSTLFDATVKLRWMSFASNPDQSKDTSYFTSSLGKYEKFIKVSIYFQWNLEQYFSIIKQYNIEEVDNCEINGKFNVSKYCVQWLNYYYYSNIIIIQSL